MARKRKTKVKTIVSFPILRPDAAGVDIGAHEIYVAVPPDRDSQPVRCFTTFTHDLHALADWLQQCRIQTVAMESTGVYWIPIFQNYFCFCKYCNEIFQDLFHYEMPRDLRNQYNPEFRRQMLVVYMHGVHYFTSEVSKEIKSIRNVPILVNLCSPSIRTVRYPAMTPDWVDGALVAEIHRGHPFGSPVAMNFINALVSTKVGTAWRKASWCYCPIGPHEQYVTYDNLETKLFGMAQLAHGATPLMETLEAYLYDPTGLPAVRDVFATLKKHTGLFMEYTPVPFVALHCWFLSRICG